MRTCVEAVKRSQEVGFRLIREKKLGSGLIVREEIRRVRSQLSRFFAVTHQLARLRVGAGPGEMNCKNSDCLIMKDKVSYSTAAQDKWILD
jgi:hypothetical protein